PISTKPTDIDVGTQLIAAVSPNPTASTSVPEMKTDEDVEAQFIVPELQENDETSQSIPISENEQFSLNDIVTADLRQGGVLSRRLPGYEERAAQVEMATLVAHSL